MKLFIILGFTLFSLTVGAHNEKWNRGYSIRTDSHTLINEVFKGERGIISGELAFLDFSKNMGKLEPFIGFSSLDVNGSSDYESFIWRLGVLYNFKEPSDKQKVILQALSSLIHLSEDDQVAESEGYILNLGFGVKIFANSRFAFSIMGNYFKGLNLETKFREGETGEDLEVSGPSLSTGFSFYFGEPYTKVKK